MSRPRCSGITVFFALTAFFHSLYAQEHRWPIDGPAFSASPLEIQSAANRIKPEPFADVTVLFEQESYRLDSVGKVIDARGDR
jgi:hypothetical protein